MQVSSLKALIALVVLAIATTGWVADRRHQFNLGKAWCQEQQANQIIEQIPEAIKRTERTTNTINEITNERKRIVDDVRNEAAKQNRPVECDLSDSELLKFNELLQEGG